MAMTNGYLPVDPANELDLEVMQRLFKEACVIDAAEAVGIIPATPKAVNAPVVDVVDRPTVWIEPREKAARHRTAEVKDRKRMARNSRRRNRGK